MGRPVGPPGLTRPPLPGGAGSHQSRLRALQTGGAGGTTAGGGTVGLYSSPSLASSIASRNSGGTTVDDLPGGWY